jgi:class 3 adenylate cyclase/tetratricopeptide (TPR) repeat protein
MSEVGRLLERVGLRQYAGLFEGRSVDLDGLMRLTERELEELGLSPAARRTLLREIRRLDPADSPPAPLAATDAERRQLTLMFCDLVDSVGLSNRLDPEDLRDVIAAYQRVCTQSIRRYEGHVARYVGDGILAFFGYPSAHEDDAERAVRAGRDLVEAVTRLNDKFANLDGFRLQARVGIATGLVVVGDVAAGGVTEKDAVAGEAANLASRLQGLARPSTVVVSALTREIAAETFEYRDLGGQNLKGFEAPIAAYEIVAEREVTRLEARNAAQTPFVNRNDEIGTMLRCWQRAAAGEGHVLVVSGEAGIGKSRVVAEGCARMRRLQPASEAAGARPLIFQCAPYHANSALYPVVRQLSTLAGIAPSDTDQTKFDKLDRLIGQAPRDPERTPALIAELLGVKPNQRYAPVAGGSREKREMTIDALVDWCASRLSDRTPIIIFEDVQWIDPTSRLFLRRLADWAERARVLLIITARGDSGINVAALFEEASPPTTGARPLPHVTFCEIGELSQSHTRQLIVSAAKDREISDGEMADLLEKSAGLPLYVEELTKSFLQTRAALAGPPTNHPRSSSVPHTISDALMARLDQLGRAKEIAQYAAVIGQEFSLSLLARVTTNSADEVVPYLNALVESGIVAPSDSAADVYHFRHALIRDIAYHSLLNRTRKRIHVKIASELAQPSVEPVVATDDLIAQHYSLGGAHRQALTFWRRGATDAIARSAHEEALGMLDSAFGDFRRLRGTELSPVELELVLAQAMALRSIRGYSATEVKERLVRARDLCRTTGSDDKRFNVEWGLFQHSIVRADIDEARQIATTLFDLAEHHPDRPLADAYLANGIIAFVLGEFERAKTLFEKGLDLSHPETDEPHFLTHGQNPGLFCLSYLAHTLCFLGYLDLAKSAIGRSLAIAEARAREPAHIYGYVNALTFAVRVYQFCGDVALEKQIVEKLASTAKRNHYNYYDALGRCHLGWVIGAEGRLSEGIDQMIDGIAALDKTGTSLALAGFYTLLAELYIRAGRVPEAAEALARITSRNAPATWDAEIERLRGDILLAQSHPDPEAAKAAYRSSLVIADRQGARLLMLKAGLSLSALLRRTNRRREAREILVQCLGQMPDGLDSQEVRAARAAIKELAKEES